MLAPISWLKDYVDIKLDLKNLMWRMTEVGLTTEGYHETEGEKVLDVEVTPNRPDWLSILGIAREIAAVQGSKVSPPVLQDIPTKKGDLPISVSIDPVLCPRYTAVAVKNVTVAPSPEWLQKKLKLVGLRPINNLVDITNYIMFELGVPIHVFDYDKFQNNKLIMQKAVGGEKFTSVDGISYELPKNTIIIKDGERVIDLCGLKGGANTGISDTTTNIFIHIPIYAPQMIRRTSQALKLSSEASYIYERGANAGGTLDSLKRVIALVLELGGGEIASNVTDVKREKFQPWRLELNLKNLEKVLGIKISDDKIVKILSTLNLSPTKAKAKIVCTIPTYRGDLKLEEDLIEEVARIYGYNNFPKTLPVGETPKEKIPYYFDNNFQIFTKNLLSSAGYTEVMTYSLISEDLISSIKGKIDGYIRLSNPVSIDFQYLRSSLVPNLLTALKTNPSKVSVKLFEIGKVYKGPPEKAIEPYLVSGITRATNFIDFKGSIDFLLKRINLDSYEIEEVTGSDNLWHPFKSATVSVGTIVVGTFGQINPLVCESLDIDDEVFAFEFDLAAFERFAKDKVYKSISKYPAQIEDITLTFPEKTEIGKVMSFVLEESNYVSKIELVDTYQKSFTFRIWYQNTNKTLTNEEVEKERDKILRELKQKFGASI